MLIAERACELCATPHQEPNPGGQPHADVEEDRNAPMR